MENYQDVFAFPLSNKFLSSIKSPLDILTEKQNQARSPRGIPAVQRLKAVMLNFVIIAVIPGMPIIPAETATVPNARPW